MDSLNFVITIHANIYTSYWWEGHNCSPPLNPTNKDLVATALLRYSYSNVISPEGKALSHSLNVAFCKAREYGWGGGSVSALGSWRPTGIIHINTPCHWLINIANKWRLPRQGAGVHEVSSNVCLTISPVLKEVILGSDVGRTHKDNTLWQQKRSGEMSVCLDLFLLFHWVA